MIVESNFKLKSESSRSSIFIHFNHRDMYFLKHFKWPRTICLPNKPIQFLNGAKCVMFNGKKFSSFSKLKENSTIAWKDIDTITYSQNVKAAVSFFDSTCSKNANDLYLLHSFNRNKWRLLRAPVGGKTWQDKPRLFWTRFATKSDIDDLEMKLKLLLISIRLNQSVLKIFISHSEDYYPS